MKSLLPGSMNLLVLMKTSGSNDALGELTQKQNSYFYPLKDWVKTLSLLGMHNEQGDTSEIYPTWFHRQVWGTK